MKEVGYYKNQVNMQEQNDQDFKDQAKKNKIELN